MQTTVTRLATGILAVLCIVMLTLIFTQRHPIDLSVLASPELQNFKTVMISIILEALPFVLLGVLVSAVLQIFVSEQTIRKIIPKNPVLGVVFASLLGLIFPLCECGMIPVIRRLMHKGMPAYIAVVFILVGPIINPVVYASTYMAFRSRPEIAYSRMGLAFAVALVIGLIVYRFVSTSPLRPAGISAAHTHHETAHHTGHARLHDHAGSRSPHTAGPQTRNHDGRHVHGHNHNHSHTHEHAHHGVKGKVSAVFGHASDEFFDMGKYLIFGACITALIQTFVDRESLVSIGQGAVVSHLFMMGLAFVLSLCSTSDAFVASSFATSFSTGSLLTFLVFGPMLDTKSTLMLLSAFRARFVALLALLVTVTVLAGSLIFERLFFMT